MSQELSSKIAKMEELIKELNAASAAYYGIQPEIMSNFEWDAKFDELTELEKETGMVLDGSPTHKVSSESDEGEEVPDEYKSEHEFSALSLPKSKDVNVLVKWADGRPVILSWKLDGMTLVVTYDNGTLTKVVTRGNGHIGSDITHLSDIIFGIPKTIPYDGHLVVRGEAVISYSDFDRINESEGGDYANARNLVSGTLNPKTTDIKALESRHVTWIPFKLVSFDWSQVNSVIAENLRAGTKVIQSEYDARELTTYLSSWRYRMKFLEFMGMKPVESEFVEDPNKLPEVIKSWSDRAVNMDYPVDGLVIAYDDTEYASHGEDGEHHNSREGFAFKWQDEEAETVLTGVDWSVSVNSINPVAMFEPVSLENTRVKRASLCNISECKRLGIGGIGTKLSVIKANKIIPKVVRAEAVGTFEMPKICPICGHDTALEVSEKGIEKLVCTNAKCGAKNVQRLVRFAGKWGFNIIGLSEATIRQMISLGMISDFVSLITLYDKEDERWNKVKGLAGWGTIRIKNIITSIKKSIDVSAVNFIYALGIPQCGRDMAKRLTSQYSVRELIDVAVRDAKEGTDCILSGSDHIGDVKAGEFIDWFGNEDNEIMVRTLLTLCHIKEQNKQADSVHTIGKCDGLKFAVTGNLVTFSDRNAFIMYVEQQGGIVLSGITKNVNYLVNNNIYSHSAKNVKAKDLGIEIITEDKFREMFM